MGRKFFVSDCEGPISVNDNAFELSGHFIDDGETFFKIVSKYDDILADVLKRPGYNAGGTLKLILPFLKAYGATNQNIIDFSIENIHLIPGAMETLSFVNSTMPSFIVSTSYDHYIMALCNRTGFPYNNTYSTKLDMDIKELNPEEVKLIKEFRKKIVEKPEFEVLDDIFWDKLPQLDISSFMDNVNPIGGEGKKEAVLDIISRFKLKASDLFYIGDSITDVQPLKFANDNGGIAVSFNGNQYAIKESEIAVIADNTTITSLLADIFNRYGTDNVLEFAVSYSEDAMAALKTSFVNPKLAKQIMETENLPHVEIITCNNMDSLIEKSSEFRRKLRGESIGGLG
jgi:energy-converting hydrogenase A subunit R